MNTKLLAVIAILVLGFGCTQPQNETTAVSSEKDTTQVTFDELSKGFQMLESSCFSCHSPNMNIETKVAPTMAEIKLAYSQSETSKEDFVNAIVAFVQHPDVDKSRIPEATELYGIMPQFNFSPEHIRLMACYIYLTELDKEDWYATQFEAEKQKYKVTLSDLSYAELGKFYAMSTKSVLGKNLTAAIKAHGTEGALSFCNEKAYPLTDSMSKLLNTHIKRVSDKPRNPANSANDTELEYIAATKLILAEQGEPKPQIKEVDGKVIAYYPITTNTMCLQCHGDVKLDLKPQTTKKIKTLYPHDQAVGYGENQLRGIWVIEMDKK